MKKVFADTGYWIAQVDATDQWHRKAEEVTNQLTPCCIVTTEMVLVEFLNFVTGCRRNLRLCAVERVERLRTDPNVEVVPQTSEQFAEALALFSHRLYKRWSLTDCASFVLMAQRRISEALANDRDFEQAGFVALLRESNELP